ncbi:hypothetical protein COLO4_05534 [Corchorus olitorius]|uniref:Uncharacterized protein n=1 Tax=Corchorus olitorius TaxID=93759 RepID=A0A1R3KQM7_9ROSI|nr:hypothetical protein COLO4_05534 [Corchorus olitorius]
MGGVSVPVGSVGFRVIPVVCFLVELDVGGADEQLQLLHRGRRTLEPGHGV